MMRPETCDGCNREAEIRVIVEGHPYCADCRDKWLDAEIFDAISEGRYAPPAPQEARP